MNGFSIRGLPTVAVVCLLSQLLACSLPAQVLAEPDAKPSARPRTTPLDDYVDAIDDAFAWQVVARRELDTHKELVIDLTSQRWRTQGEVDRPLWKHWLTVIVPHDAESTTALLMIVGGSNREEPPQETQDWLLGVALRTRSVMAILPTVPNQPLELNGDGELRKEDNLLAASWVSCMSTDDPTWLAQLPMAKSAVAGMDAVEQVLADEPGAPRIDKFAVTGASKRGWTTWLAAAVDPRVVAIAPIVIDLLNIAPSMKHHHAVLGFWSEALHDYEDQGLAERLDDPQSAAIRAIVDPLNYRLRLDMPKCLINAAGDEFFLPDSSRFYFADLIGEKHLSYTPNTGHSLEGSDALETLIAFHASVVHGLDRPTLSWSGEQGDTEHTVWCTAKPIEATLWRAINPDARDFRHKVLGDLYKPTELAPDEHGGYHVKVTAPPEGFSATFVRFTFDIGAATPFRISTPVWVAPDVEPFAKE